MAEKLYRKFVNWLNHLKHKECRPITQVLHHIFTYNISPTTNQSVLTDDTAYLINSILVNQPIDLSAILCHMMIRLLEAAHSTGSLPYPTLITDLL